MRRPRGRETREYLGEKAREGRERATDAAEKGRQVDQSGPRDAERRRSSGDARPINRRGAGDRVNGWTERVSRHHRRRDAGHRDRADARASSPPACWRAASAGWSIRSSGELKPIFGHLQRHRPRRLARRGAGRRAGRARRSPVRAISRSESSRRSTRSRRASSQPAARRARAPQRLSRRPRGDPRHPSAVRAGAAREDEDALFISPVIPDQTLSAVFRRAGSAARVPVQTNALLIGQPAPLQIVEGAHGGVAAMPDQPPLATGPSGRSVPAIAQPGNPSAASGRPCNVVIAAKLSRRPGSRPIAANRPVGRRRGLASRHRVDRCRTGCYNGCA